MFRQVTPRNVGRVLPAWLAFMAGFVLAAVSDTKGWTVLMVVGFLIAIPRVVIVFVQVARIPLPFLRR